MKENRLTERIRETGHKPCQEGLCVFGYQSSLNDHCPLVDHVQPASQASRTLIVFSRRPLWPCA
jgi:hypothetical protein